MRFKFHPLSRFSLSERHNHRALEMDSTIAAHDHLGVIALRTKDFAAPEREFRTELKAHPADTRARYHLAIGLL